MKTRAEVEEAYRSYLAGREEQPFAMDGIVVKVDDLALRRLLGEGARAPFWAAARKFPPPTAETVVRSIRWSVGRTGRRTPIAEVVPVRLGGVLVGRISLHDANEVARLDIAAGDRVVVGLIGDVIPRVLQVADRAPRHGNAGGGPSVTAPTPDACLRDGPGCREQFLSRLVHFVARPGLHIAGLGRGRLQKLVEAGLVADLPSLFRLRTEEVAAVPGFGGKTAQQLTAALGNSRRFGQFRMVAALGIPGVGRVSTKRLAGRFRTLRALLDLDEDRLTVRCGADVRGARLIRSFFRTSGGRDLLEEFRGMGMFPN